MKSLPKPIDYVGDVFTTCISRVREPLKTSLAGVLPAVIATASEYDRLAQSTDLHMLSQVLVTNGVSKADQVKIYDDRMAKKDKAGRIIYDRIKNSAPHKMCPLCAHRVVSTLDHILPKAYYPLLSVTPLNLVPCCRDCNTDKLDTPPTGKEDQFFHPYYDDFNDGIWLAARFIYDVEVIPEFLVIKPDGWDQVKFKRACNHFDKLGLDELYSLNAMTELGGNKHIFEDLFEDERPEDLKADLEKRASSWTRTRPNSWQAAIYRAAASDSLYYGGGFREIPEE
jgi:5-methylcytosine-specific restriction endonuclease McrA